LPRLLCRAVEPGDLAPVVDVELIGHGTPPGVPQRLRRWLEIVETHYGVKPIIYTMASFWDAHMDDTFGDYPLWVAEYEVEKPRLPAGWSEWHMWQWQGDADVPGVENLVDLGPFTDPANIWVKSVPFMLNAVGDIAESRALNLEAPDEWLLAEDDGALGSGHPVVKRGAHANEEHLGMPLAKRRAEERIPEPGVERIAEVPAPGDVEHAHGGARRGEARHRPGR